MPLTDTQKQERLDALTAGADLAQGGGSVDQWFDRRLARFNERNPGMSTTFDPASASISDYTAAQGLWNRALYQGGKNRGAHGTGTPGEFQKPRPSVFRGKVKERIAENAVEEGNRLDKEVYGPTWDRAQNSINEMLDKPLFDETLLHQTRSNIAQQVKGAEQASLRRAAAALGIRGLDPSSPAGAAIAARRTLEADATLANSLRDYSIQTNMAEENSRMAEIGLASDLVTKRMAATSALKAGNLDRLFAVSSDLDALMESLRQQREYQAWMNAQQRSADSGGWGGLAGSALGMATGLIPGVGPLGMMAFSQLGGAVGSKVGGGAAPNMSGFGSLMGQFGFTDPWSWTRQGASPTGVPQLPAGQTAQGPTMAQFFGGM